jgi:signal transduction histidine kinase
MSRVRHSSVILLTSGVLAVMVVVVVVVVGAALGTHKLVSDQEQKLLKQRTDELGLVIKAVSPTVLDGLTPLAAAARGPDPASSFASSARLPAAARDAVLLSIGAGGRATVLAAVGPDFHSGEIVSGAVGEAATEAGKTASFVVSPVFHSGPTQLTAVVFAAGLPAGEVVAQVSVLHPVSANASNTSGPYSELDVALYRGSSKVASQLVEANAPLASFGSHTISEVVHLGATPFLLITAARSSLVGSVELNSQWVVLGLGLLLTLLLGVMFAGTQRRRDYALDLVDERTGELNESLAQLRQAQDQLVHRERLAAIGELASAVGHELRNPLAVISNALYLLRRATAGTEDARVGTHLSTAEREVAAANLIVSDLLEYSRGRQPILAEVDLADLIDETLAVAPHPEMVTVDWHPPTGPLMGSVDRDQMRQVLLNLVTNAYDAMSDGGRLTIGLSHDGEGLTTLEVADTGSGMDEETRRRIFEPFFTTKARGVGLGLAVCHRIVASHGGGISVESTPGVGSTFTITIPHRSRAAVPDDHGKVLA